MSFDTTEDRARRTSVKAPPLRGAVSKLRNRNWREAGACLRTELPTSAVSGDGQTQKDRATERSAGTIRFRALSDAA